ncbi:MAG TPA: dihydroorotase [Flavisolibacter sp.]|nr:dihydroorotase [Flavisolibacter sp.]
MDILLRQATVIDPSSPFHLQQADILISNGVFKAIETAIDVHADQVVRHDHLCISPGWVDVFAHFNDPGLEFKETLESGAQAAASGGYSDVMIVPNTNPCLHNKAAVAYGVQRGNLLPVNIHPIGAITKNTEGKELSEMYDMHASGAIAFSDGMNPVQSSGLLLKALLYLKAIDSTIIQIPEDRSLNNNGLMHEGVVSTGLGLPGKPAIAEELMIARDIELVKYTGSKIHFTAISTARSVELIRQAKKEGVSVTCSVTPYHLHFCDEDMKTYDTHLKVNPPMRTQNDRKALQEAVLDGTIDCIATHHLPEDIDNKVIEFEYAKNGMIGLQTAFAVVMNALPQLSAERVVELFCKAPRQIFGLPSPQIRIGMPAQCSLFSFNSKWTFTKEKNRSLSANSPFFEMQFEAKPLGIINKGSLFLNTE